MAIRRLRAIIFDIGRVLVRLDLGRAMKELGSGLALSPAELWAMIEKDPLWADWQEGRVSPRDWHLQLTRRLGIPLPFEQFVQVWNLVMDPEPMQGDEFFRALAKSHRLALISNTDRIHVAHLEATYGFVRYFPAKARIYSCAHGASKPNPLLYLAALRACRVEAHEAVYIDDVLGYVEAARNLGMSGIHYQSGEKLVTELGELGAKVG
jgi:HAD superfamily hydrolase (TIGR01509 family)